jgi:hypothetical protein
MNRIVFLLLATTGWLLAGDPIPSPAALPKPPGWKAVAETPDVAIYEAPGAAEAVRQDVAKAFAAAGWTPYGSTGETRSFKKGRVKAQSTVNPPPAPTAKTMVSFMVEALSADLPLPPDGKDVQFTSSTKELGFTTGQTPEELAVTYGKLLEPAGWFTKMAKPDQDELDRVMIFRHATEGKIELKVRPLEVGWRATATYQTQAEVDAEQARAKKQGDALRAKLAAEGAAPRPEVLITLPKGTTRHFPVKNGLTIELKVGTGLAGAKTISAGLKQQGWTETAPVPLAKETGHLEFTRDTLRLTITYMDPGPVPAEMTIAAPQMTLRVEP